MKKLFILLCISLTALTALAADGDLDTSFDGDGRVVTNLLTDDNASEIVQLPDGKLLVYGLVGAGSFNGFARYNADGTLDTTFGTGGKVILDQPQGKLNAVKVQPDGKIVGATFDGYLVRLNANGSLDTTLDSGNPNQPNGFRRIRINDDTFTFNDMAVQPDGKYLFATSTVVTIPTFAFVFAVVRVNQDGTNDTSFGNGGLLTANAPRGIAESIDLSPDNKIVVAGFSFDTPTGQGSNVAVLRYNLNGSPDATFSGDGKAFGSFQFPGGADSVRLAVHTDGKIAVSRNYSDNANLVYLAKFNADGSPDAGFGTSGEVRRVAINNGFTFVYEIIFQPDGKLVVFGLAPPQPATSDYGVLVARYNLNGTLDAGFGTNGFRVTLFNYTSPGGTTVIAYSQARAGLLQADGKIVAAGYADFNIANGSQNFALVRLQNSISQPPVNNPALRIADFDGDGKTDASVFRNGTWFINPSSNPSALAPQGFYAVQFGLATDKLTPADFDGDGKTDVAVWRENGSLGFFYILQSATGTVRTAQFGAAGDSPIVAGDWDADGKADPAVFRSGGGQSFFFYRPSSQPGVDFVTIPWGTAGDKPVRGDFDGDGKLDAAVFRPSTNLWYIRQSSNNQLRVENWGLATDRFVPADYDGDAKTDVAVFRDGIWYIRQSSNNQPLYRNWGTNTDALVPGDYDGDGRSDVAVWRAGVFYILSSANSSAAYQNFGAAGDAPVAAAFVQ